MHLHGSLGELALHKLITIKRRCERVDRSVTRRARAEAMAATAVMQPAAVSFLSSSTGLLAMLDEEDNQLKAHALANINAVVPDFWAESEFCTGTAGARAHLARR